MLGAYCPLHTALGVGLYILKCDGMLIGDSGAGQQGEGAYLWTDCSVQ